MKQMFDFPFQQRQRENLVEKLLKRLNTAEQENWGRVAHCLAQLKYSSSFKVVSKLLDSENRKLYAGKLGVPEVWEAFEKIKEEVERLMQKKSDTVPKFMINEFFFHLRTKRTKSKHGKSGLMM